MKYDDNIELDFVREDRKLKPNEYFVLMVHDELNKHLRPQKDYFNYKAGWIGIERTSAEKIYISKEFNQRSDYHRGITMVATVKDVSKCCVL